MVDHLKKCRSPGREKCRDDCFGKCWPQTGCRGNCRKEVLLVPSPRLYYTSTETRNPKHFFGTFLGTPFGTGTFRSTLLGTFSLWGLRHFFKMVAKVVDLQLAKFLGSGRGAFGEVPASSGRSREIPQGLGKSDPPPSETQELSPN